MNELTDRSLEQEEYLSKSRALALWDSGAILEFEVGTIKGLQEIHYALFHGLDGFQAGKLRDINISKQGFRFASAIYLSSAAQAIEKMPQQTFDEIIDKYVEMNILHPFIEGNGRATRIWLDLILKQELALCIDWQKINKKDYLSAMAMSPTNSHFIKALLKEALTDAIDNRQVYMKGIEQSYRYEELDTYSMEEIDSKHSVEKDEREFN
ncbi:Fic family protein [Aerococcus urinae]|nr:MULTISPECIES: Fic family protein [Aerococcus]MCY3084062.1 Fic family protein [Aerococcus mictus]MDK6231535.1 Fic family protein [Aerococcus urinae]MDK6257533.1 Fic family protein [Aerococcus urinae]MDK6293886.1 Fic family protein [Aerococcus urinae]MDK6626912.1 Fic family protein [Aerococcus urinae]